MGFYPMEKKAFLFLKSLFFDVDTENSGRAACCRPRTR